jgi:hypothetical protein
VPSERDIFVTPEHFHEACARALFGNDRKGKRGKLVCEENVDIKLLEIGEFSFSSSNAPTEETLKGGLWC